MEYKKGWNFDNNVSWFDCVYFPESSDDLNDFNFSVDAYSKDPPTFTTWDGPDMSLVKHDDEPLSNYFTDVLNPTENELMMFQLQFGVDISEVLTKYREWMNT